MLRTVRGRLGLKASRHDNTRYLPESSDRIRAILYAIFGLMNLAARCILWLARKFDQADSFALRMALSPLDREHGGLYGPGAEPIQGQGEPLFCANADCPTTTTKGRRQLKNHQQLFLLARIRDVRS